MDKKRIYLDYNATAPLSAEVKDFYIKELEYYANGSSLHADGRTVAKKIENARAQVAGLVNANPDEIVFWRAMIAELNIINQFESPITYVCVDYKDGQKGFMIIFGSIFQIEEVEIKQACFEAWLPTIKNQYYNKQYKNK